MDLYDNWYEEKRSSYLYGIMAQNEKNILQQKLFLDLQKAADKQASVWQAKINAQPRASVCTFTPDMRTRIVAFLIAYLGTKRIHLILSAMKIRGMSLYTDAHPEHKHTSMNSASNLRAAVFGINDGLVSNMSLILGMVGANANEHYIVLAGIAGLLAGAFSMGAGEYISVRTQREVFEYQIAIEKEELAEYPEEEMEELNLIYQARGIPKEEAKKLAELMINNPETALITLAREELGLNPEELVSPIGAMLASFLSFALGAFIPLLPFYFHFAAGTRLSLALTGITLFIIGMILSLFSNRNPFYSGFRMLSIGAVAGWVTYLVGKWLGINL